MSQMMPRSEERLRTCLQMVERALESFSSQPGAVFSEIRLYDSSELLLDYHPLPENSIERTGSAMVGSARVWLAGRCGFATGTILGRQDLEALLESAREASETAPFSEPPTAVFTETTPDNLPGEFSGKRANQQARHLARSLEQQGQAKIQTLLVKQMSGTIIIANSAGLRVVEHSDAEEILLRCETSCGAIVDGMMRPCCSTEPWNLEPLVDRMQEAFHTVAEAGDAPDPRLPMVLRPPVAGPLVAGLAWFLRADTAIRTPKLATALTHKIFPTHLTVYDDPLLPAGTRKRQYDDEGQPAASLSLIQNGRLMNFLQTVQTARQLEGKSNGRGVVAAGRNLAPPAPQALNLYVSPGSMQLPAKYLELSTKLETLKSMPRAGLITMTVAGWLVREGTRIGRVRPFDLHLPLLPTWRKLAGVGDDLCFLSCSDGCGTPSLLFPSLVSGA